MLYAGDGPDIILSESGDVVVYISDGPPEDWDDNYLLVCSNSIQPPEYFDVWLSMVCVTCEEPNTIVNFNFFPGYNVECFIGGDEETEVTSLDWNYEVSTEFIDLDSRTHATIALAQIDPEIFNGNNGNPIMMTYLDQSGNKVKQAGVLKVIIDAKFSKTSQDRQANLMAENQFQLAPNPSSGLIQISGAASDQVNIYNSNGEWMESVILGGDSQQVDLSHFPKGIYFLRSKQNDHAFTQKLILY